MSDYLKYKRNFKIEIPRGKEERIKFLEDLALQHSHLYEICDELGISIIQVRNLYQRAGLEVPKPIPESLKKQLLIDYSDPDCSVHDLSKEYNIPSDFMNRILLEAFFEFIKLPDWLPPPLDCFELKIACFLLKKPELRRKENQRFISYQFKCKPYRLEDYLERRLPKVDELDTDLLRV